MQYIKADTITEVTVGPAVAVGDGFTPVTNLVGSTADEFEIIKHGATTTTTIAGTLAAITGADGYYALDLSATDSNTEGRLTLLINDDSLILPIRMEFMVVNANVFDSLFAAATTDYLQVDTIQVGGATEDIATETKQDTIDSNVDEVLLDTAEIGAAGAGLTNINLPNQTMDITGSITGNLSGSVGSVTGAVGSVTGAVGSVTGSVGSLTGHTNQTADHTANIAAILTDTGTTLETHLTDLKGATFSGATDSNEAIRNRGDAAWTTGAGGSPPTTLQSTTIATLASQVSFTLTAGSADDDAYNGMIVVVEDQATSTQKCIGKISDYTGSTRTVTLIADPGVFTMATGDTIDVVAINDRVTLTDTTTTNTDMRGTDSAATAASLATAQLDLDTLTGTDGATLATAQGNYAPAVAGDSMDMSSISGDTVAADNLESQYDTTGLTGDTFPGTQSQLSSIANVGSAIHKPALSYTLTTGTQSANTVSATEALDGTRHEHTDTAGAMELYYEFAIGAGVPSSVQLTGYLTGGNDDLDVYGYDWVAAAWVQIGNLVGGGSTANSVYSYDMFVNMVGTGANAGMVRVRLYKVSGLTTATLAVDQIFVAFSQDSVSALNSVYFDSGASNTGTTSIDGVPGNPVSTEAAVNTLLAARNLRRVEVELESSITFATSHANEIWSGPHWDLAQGGQDLTGSHFVGADVTGTASASVEKIDYLNCSFGTCSLPKMHAFSCGLTGTITFNEAGDYVYANCHSAVAGSTTPIIDTGAAIGNVNLSMPDYQQGIEIQNLNGTGTDLFSISGTGQIVYAASSSGAVNQRGSWKVTNTGGATITEDDNTASITLIEADTNELQTDDVPGLIAALNDPSVADILTTQMTQSYAADGVAPTLAQALFLIQQSLGDFSISGTTVTVRQINGSTTAATFTLDDGTNPTSSTRAT